MVVVVVVVRRLRRLRCVTLFISSPSLFGSEEPETATINANPTEIGPFSFFSKSWLVSHTKLG
jgi:hypothetical protein